MKEIDLNIGNIKIGHAEDKEKGTGVTVIMCEPGMRAGMSVAGGGPASRETTLLNELSAADQIHAVVLAGGSAFGLGAAGGVMRFLAERGYGYETGYAKVPLVVQSDLYDLGVGDPTAYPDEQLAYEAAQRALENFNRGLAPEQGSIGAGTGATVGKLFGAERMMKSGIGTYAAEIGELQMGCIVAVNALGDVIDIETGEQIAGLLNEDQDELVSTRETMFSMGEIKPKDPFDPSNTTIGCLITNACFSKRELNKVAQMAQDGLAMAINPVHTTADGDTLYIVSDGDVVADINLAGTLAAYVCAKAVNNAIRNAEPLFNLKTYSDLTKKR